MATLTLKESPTSTIPTRGTCRQLAVHMARGQGQGETSLVSFPKFKNSKF